jgi:hypothetical protein
MAQPTPMTLAAQLSHGFCDFNGSSARYGFFGECGFPVKKTKQALEKSCADAGIGDLNSIDLRHEAGSRLLGSGWPIHHVKEMLLLANFS